MTKRKDERRELLKEDEFHSFLERVARYSQQNSRQVTIAAAATLILLAAFFLWIRHLDTKRNDQAQELYSAEKILNTDLNDEQAELKFDSENAKYEAALKELDTVIASNSGVVKQQAIIQKVSALVHLGRQDEIEGLYQELAASDQGLKAFALMGLGDLYLSEGRYKEARDQYSQLEGLRGVPKMADLVRYKMAVCYKEEGELDSAKAELDQLVQSYSDEDDASKPPIFNKARQLLDELEKDVSAETPS